MKPTGFLFSSALISAVLALNACAVGPDYHAPAAPAVASITPAPLPPATLQAGGTAQHFVSGGDISGEWWSLFHSEELNALINAALANNPTLQASQQTLVEAQENVRAAYGQLIPAVSGSFQDERQQPSSASSAAFGGSATKSIAPYTLYNASLSVSYGLDIWGGARRDVESLQAQADYQRYQLEAAYLSLTANIVTAAVNEASLHAQIDATNAIIATEQKQLDILNRQFALGGVPKANIISEQATLASTQATLPPLQSQLAQIRNQLADYVGQFPSNYHEADFTLASLHLPDDVPASLPSALVDQRPDIQAAAQQLHEASANVGVATAQMLPQITLSASIGHDALTTASLFTPQTLIWSLVAGVTQPIFQGGELAAKRKAAIAALHVAGSQYQATVLAAFQNVADALQALQFDAQTLQAAQLAEASSAQSLAVTQSQFKYGSQPFTAVLTAQASYQNALIARVKAQSTRLADTAALFQALGGGWWHRDDVSEAVKTCCGIIP
ncbi:MAG TPA: efflux transporter outer membrane subunit [Acidocella sp.]|nr:MAG: RND transporter [Acidocella sp. 20-58-15]HQT39395.1 efflux transporter outer membrane subunit [Acidocella sp.]